MSDIKAINLASAAAEKMIADTQAGAPYGFESESGRALSVEAVLAEVETWTAAEAEIAGEAWVSVRDGRYAAAWGEARKAGRHAALDAAWAAVNGAAYGAAWGAARGAVLGAAYDAAMCVIVGDLISEEHREVLNAGLNAVREHRGVS
jgi:hypothetical protein